MNFLTQINQKYKLKNNYDKKNNVFLLSAIPML